MIVGWALVALLILSFVCTALTTTLGLGGGALFLAGASFALPMVTALTLHAIFNAIGNAGRVLVLKKKVIVINVIVFFVFLIPGAALAQLLLVHIQTGWLQPLCGLGLILSALKMNYTPRKSYSKTKFAIAGFIAGSIGPLIGAIGPLISPLFLSAGNDQESFVANKSCCQFLTQIAKLSVYSSSLATTTSSPTLIIYIAAIFAGLLPGLFLGHHGLKNLSPHLFTVLVRVLVGLSGGGLILKFFLS